MNSKQRILTTLDHQIPDRMPLDIWTSDPIKTSLCRYYGVDDFEDVLQCLGIDIRSVWPVEPPRGDWSTRTRVALDVQGFVRVRRENRLVFRDCVILTNS